MMFFPAATLQPVEADENFQKSWGVFSEELGRREGLFLSKR